MKLLHIVATPRNHKSSTLKISDHLIAEITKKQPELKVTRLDLFDEDLPAVAGEAIEAKYALMSQLELDDLKRQSWSMVESRISQFLAADTYVITSPMWNFSIPYVLKFYIDTIIQPNYMFRYTETGQPVGMVHDKKMIVVTSRGGDYSPASPAHVMDFQEPYLRALFGFIGITDVNFINAQPINITPDLRDKAIAEALETATRLAADCF